MENVLVTPPSRVAGMHLLAHISTRPISRLIRCHRQSIILLGTPYNLRHHIYIQIGPLEQLVLRDAVSSINETASSQYGPQVRLYPLQCISMKQMRVMLLYSNTFQNPPSRTSLSGTLPMLVLQRWITISQTIYFTSTWSGNCKWSARQMAKTGPLNLD